MEEILVPYSPIMHLLLSNAHTQRGEATTKVISGAERKHRTIREPERQRLKARRKTIYEFLSFSALSALCGETSSELTTEGTDSTEPLDVQPVKARKTGGAAVRREKVRDLCLS
jgi:hypothetical protein